MGISKRRDRGVLDDHLELEAAGLICKSHLRPSPSAGLDLLPPTISEARVSRLEPEIFHHYQVDLHYEQNEGTEVILAMVLAFQEIL